MAIRRKLKYAWGRSWEALDGWLDNNVPRYAFTESPRRWYRQGCWGCSIGLYRIWDKYCDENQVTAKRDDA